MGIEPGSIDTDQADSWRLGCAILGLVLLLLAAVPIAYLGYHYALRQAPDLFSDPLRPEVANDLCALLDLTGDVRCNEGSVYAYELIPDLRTRHPQGTAGDVVDGELGKYADYCSEWISRGANGDFQDCQYTLDGDRHLMLYVTQRKDPGADEKTAEVWRSCSYDVGNGSVWDIYACEPPLNTGLLLVMSDNTFLTAPGFGIAFLAFDVVIVSLVVLLRRPLGIRD
jgi:hypothetical protein